MKAIYLRQKSIMLFHDAVLALSGNLSISFAGLSNAGSASCVSGSSPLLCAPEVLSAWLVLLALTIWPGGFCWQMFIIERAAQRDSALVPVALATGARFYRLAIVALVVFLIANIGSVMGLLILQGGSWSSGFSPTLWGNALRAGSFGVFWLLSQMAALLALLLLVLFPHRSVAAEAWRPRQKLHWLELALAGLLLAALAVSEQATVARAKASLGPFAVPVEWLFLLSLLLWIGGLLSIALILIPAIWRCEAAERGRIVATVLPRSSVLALVSAVVAVLSGLFNAYVQLTSWGQFTGTPYGRALMVGLLLVVLIVSISAYRAASLRPALSRELASWDRLPAAAVSPAAGAEAASAAQTADLALSVRAQAETTKAEAAPDQAADEHDMQSGSDSDTIVASAIGKQRSWQDARAAGREPEDDSASSGALRRIEALYARFHSWLQYEAMLGGVALLCVALLGSLAGALAAPPGSNEPTLTATTRTPVNITQTAGNLTVTLKVTPDTFGTNTFGVLVVDASTGQPIDGGSVHLVITMLDMDMGTATSDLKGVGKGLYLGQGDLLMNGHWQVQVQARVPQDPTVYQFTFVFSASFS